MDHVCIGPGVAADAAEIGELYLAARNDALPFLPRIHTDERVRAWIADTLLLRCRVWVARSEQRIVGFLALNNDELEQLYVLPGQYRCGVGSKLLDVAKAESAGRLCLFTFQKNERARAFYESQGFRVVDWNDGSRNEEREPDMRYEWRAATLMPSCWRPRSAAQSPARA
jgi:GNAT superfamily N-acetyltransferase